MKKYITFQLFLLFASAAGFAQDPSAAPLAGKNIASENYIRTVTNAGGDSGLYSETLTFYDGLGRPSQQILVDGAGDASGDLITPIVYDNLGRNDARSYLPYVSNTGGIFRPNAVEEQQSYYKRVFPGEIPYAEKIYETTALNRVLESMNPGKIYRDSSRSVRYGYLTNGTDEVPLIRIHSLKEISLAEYYPSGRLIKTTSVNEDNIETISYEDFLGRTIMTRTIDGADNVDTYYVFNDLGRLVAVIPPIAVDSLIYAGPGIYPNSENLIANYCYYYQYDKCGNIIERGLPGKEVEYLVYDSADRPVFIQDGNLRKQSRWLYHEYDNIGRPVSISLVEQKAEYTRQNIQNWYERDFEKMFKIIAVLSESKYGKSGSFEIPVYLSADRSPGILSGQIDVRTGGMKIYDKLAVIDGSDYSNLSYVERAYYYDYKNRVVQTVEKNQMGGISRTGFEYDLVGNVLAKFESHQTDPLVDSADTLKSFFTYDSCNRLLSETTTLNAGVPAIVRYKYDRVGQLKTKSFGDGKSEKVKVDTACWLKVDKDKRLIHDWSVSDIMIYGSSSNFIDYDIYDFVIADDSNDINPKYLIGTDAANPRIEYYYIPKMEKLNAEIISWAISMYSEFTMDTSPKIEVVSTPFPGTGPRLAEVDVYREIDGRGMIEESDYNIQGWLTRKQAILGIGKKLFDMELYYYDPQHTVTVPSYAGNISEWSWQHANADKNTYAFSYDGLARLKDTKQYVNGLPNDLFVEKMLHYDRNGNLKYMKRTSEGQFVDIHSYQYNGNKLTSLLTRTGDKRKYYYSYDANGNMILDGRNGLNIAYNHMNLTEKVMRYGSILAKYAYLSDGTKLWAADADEFGLAYAGSLVYLKFGDEYALESAAFNGGRFIATSAGIEPNYFVSDHLGSTRVVVNPEGQIRETSDFYPFGLRWSGGQLSDNRYRYNGKEEQGFVNVPYTDYGARMYDPKYSLNWTGYDPLAEKLTSISPYAFCGNNPINRVDPDGRFFDILWDALNVIYDVGAAVYNHATGDHDAAKGYWVDASLDLGAALVPCVPAGVSKVVKVADKAVDAAKAVDKAADVAKGVDKGADAVKGAEKASKSPRSPFGSKGNLDHQQGVDKAMGQAKKELRPGEYILREKKIKVEGSNRRPDLQIIDENDKTRKVIEVERRPKSKRNQLREEEYRRLKVEHETYSL